MNTCPLYYNSGAPENLPCTLPPYNATNFTSANSTIYSTIQSYAYNSPNFPFTTGSNAQQIQNNTANMTVFNAVNNQTIAIKTLNNTLGQPYGQVPYPQFKSHQELMMYKQASYATASRNLVTGQQYLSRPAGAPFSTIYGIINGT